MAASRRCFRSGKVWRLRHYSLKEASRFSKYFRNVVLMCEKESQDSLWLKSTKKLDANKVFCSDSLSRGCNPALKKSSLILGFKFCNVCKYAALAPTYYLPAPFLSSGSFFLSLTASSSLL